MFFYRRGCLSLLIIMGSSFLSGLFFSRFLSPRSTEIKFIPQIVKQFNQDWSGSAQKIELEDVEDDIDVSAALPSIKNKLVHLDLKGAPPHMTYLAKLLPLLRNNGATGLLIEYEDTFPYTGEISELSNTAPYSLESLGHFLHKAKELNFDIIPLVQTFGHFEFALKLQKFQSLREHSVYPNSICPSNEKSIALIKEMIDQIVVFHSRFNITRLHIGCDEVHHVAECSVCHAKASQDKYGNASLILSHIKAVASHVASKNLTAIAWHDMIAGLSEEAIKFHNLADKVEIMFWDYSPKLRAVHKADHWPKMLSLFKGKIWLASSYKGATGVTQALTNPAYHLDNHRAWVRVIAKYADSHQFLGIALTGWQRYDHFSLLCELLPVGLPSLIFNLNYLANPSVSEQELVDKVTTVLRCTTTHPLEVMNMTKPIRCFYPGSVVYEIVQLTYFLRREYNDVMSKSYPRGWVTQYQIQNKFVCPDHLRLLMKPLRKIYEGLSAVLSFTYADFLNVYAVETGNEWLDTNVLDVTGEIRSMEIMAEHIMSTTSWPRRYFAKEREWKNASKVKPLIEN